VSDRDPPRNSPAAPLIETPAPELLDEPIFLDAPARSLPPPLPPTGRASSPGLAASAMPPLPLAAARPEAASRRRWIVPLAGAGLATLVVAFWALGHRTAVSHRPGSPQPSPAGATALVERRPAVAGSAGALPVAPPTVAAATPAEKPVISAAVLDHVEVEPLDGSLAVAPAPVRAGKVARPSANRAGEDTGRKEGGKGEGEGEPRRRVRAVSREEAPAGVSAGANHRIDAMLQTALDGKETRGEPRPAEVEGLPALGRDAIVAALKPLRPRIKDCYKQFGQRGVALVRVQVGDAGKVTSTRVEGSFAGSPTGACVEAIVKTVRFPESAGLAFRYPFPVR
jgi:hypothetical protein